ncbi:MAG: hypothetical protein WCJ67_07335 [Thermoleophilia bacterium]
MTNDAPVRQSRTHLWFALYTIVLFAVFGLSLATHQWSVAITSFGIALVFVLFTRWLWRRR